MARPGRFLLRPFFLVPARRLAANRRGLLALALIPACAGAQQSWKYRIEPDIVRAGTEGELVLIAHDPWPCGTVFSQLIPFQIIGNSITLGFKADTAAGPNKYAHVSNYAGCVDSTGHPAPYPTGPVFPFRILGPQVQKYQVYAKWLNGCAGAGPACYDSSTVPAGTLTVQATNPFPPGFLVAPSDTFAGRPFTLTLWNRDWDCNTRVDSGRAVVRGRTIELDYRVRKTGAATCPIMGIDPGSVPIPLPALAPGTYDVQAWGDPCPVNSTDCDGRFSIPELTLRVREEGMALPSEWYLREHWRQPDSALSLQALNRRVHFCGSRFSRMNVEVRGHQVFLRFDALALGASGCTEGPDPWGPLFSAPRLAEGVYPVFILPNVVCDGDPPVCAQGPASKDVADDTLVISRYFTGLVTSIRARNPEARFRKGQLRMALPGPGTWHAELQDANGRREATGEVAADARGEGHLDLPRAPGRGFHVLILRNAAGVTRLLPMAR